MIRFLLALLLAPIAPIVLVLLLLAPVEVLADGGGEITPGGSTGGAGVSGSPNAVVYLNPAGNAAASDSGLTASPVDQFGRPQLRDIRSLGAGLGSVWRQGAWQTDGDATNVIGEGLVLYGGSSNGIQSATEGGYNRQKADRIGLGQILPGVNGGNLYYYVRADPAGLTMKDNSATPVTTSFLDRTLGMLFLGSGSAAVGSNAGLQLSSLVANRAAVRTNQFGANAGVPGVVGFKSRGLTIGSLVKVAAGDTLWRATAIGVADDNATIGLAATIGINVPTGGVPAGQNYVATDYVLELQPLGGPVNGRKMALKIDSEGIFYVKESANTMAGVVTLDGAGVLTVANTRISGTSRITLTMQDGGSVPTGAVYVSGRSAGVSFAIGSTSGAGNAGVKVYFQIYEPATP